MKPAHETFEPSELLIDAVSLDYRIVSGAELVALTLIGELDLRTADRARDAVRRAQHDARAVICDLRDVWFVDVAGLRVLLDAAAEATRTDSRFTVTGCPPILRRMLRLLQLEDALDVQPRLRRLTASASGCDLRRRHVSSR